MRFRFGINGFLALVALAAPAFAERPYTPEATVERYVSTVDVRADGSDLETTEYVLPVDTAQGISDVGAQRDARSPLRGARDIFDALGATPWGDRARRETRPGVAQRNKVWINRSHPSEQRTALTPRTAW